jgi:ELWxxDGT repeat protein
MTNVNETLFFEANDGASGRELWKSDGTEAGTVRVKDILPGSDGSVPGSLTNVNGTLFFRADDGTSGRELWKSDGTEAGTVRVKDIRPGSAASVPLDLTKVNGTLFFTADDGVHGRELWKLLDLPELPGDTNGDGRVSLDDLNNVRNHFGETGPGVIGDTNGDGVVNVDDLNNVLNNFGATAEEETGSAPLLKATPRAAAAPAGLALATRGGGGGQASGNGQPATGAPSPPAMSNARSDRTTPRTNAVVARAFHGSAAAHNDTHASLSIRAARPLRQTSRGQDVQRAWDEVIETLTGEATIEFGVRNSQLQSR